MTKEAKELDALYHAQNDLYGRISRSFENLKKSAAGNVTVGLVEACLQALEANWAKFEAQHLEITKKYWESLEAHSYKTTNIHALTEEAYLNQKGQYLDLLRSSKTKTSEEAAITSAVGIPPSRTTLPRIQLPHFSGRYEDWPSFRDLFKSLIIQDGAASQVEKLHYLKSALKGEAELLIRNLATTSDNFVRAWDFLTEYYENKRLLVRSYISRLLALPKLKGESAPDLRKLYHGVLNTVGSLESIARPITKGEDLFVHIVTELLDARSRRDWEAQLSGKTEPPTYEQLKLFIERRLHALESLQTVKQEEIASKTNSNFAKSTRILHTRKQEGKRGRCSLCQRDHFVMLCDKYKSKSATERRAHMESNGLCLNCLGKHEVDACYSAKNCAACNGRHHTSLHDAVATLGDTRTVHVAQNSTTSTATVLLTTARVRVLDQFGNAHMARALLDQGSEAALIAESLVQRLRLPRRRTTMSVVGVGVTMTTSPRRVTDVTISSRTGQSPIVVSAFILPQLTLYDGGQRVIKKAWPHLAGLELADPDYLAKGKVELILGADIYADLLLPGLRKDKGSAPMAQQTKWGWILSGTIHSPIVGQHICTHQIGLDNNLSSLVQRFWQQEELSTAEVGLTADEQNCEAWFVQTHSRNCDGRYIVRLPVRVPLPDLSGTRHAAIRLLKTMENRFSRDGQLKQRYVDFMQEYEQLGHMTVTVPTNDNSGCFLPHHGVLKESSASTKLRVVFNGSSTVTSGECLNRNLLVGANLLPALSDVLLRWRRHVYVLATDIEKMYRQILVHADDRHLQRIMWRHDPNKDMLAYELNTVTYGLACAPFLAMRTLRQLAMDEGDRFPHGAAALLHDTYMNDVLTGTDIRIAALTLQQQLNDLCMAGGFPLRKWSANEVDLLTGIPPEHRLFQDPLSWRPDDSHGTLGLQWHPGTDTFSYVIPATNLVPTTKRAVLSLTARLFDPLGWLTPTVVLAKIWFQSTWLLGIDWDAPLDDATTRRWGDFLEALPQLKEIRVPRYLPLGAEDIELHGFADASERAYAAVVYLRSTGSDSKQMDLITAKSKVAPVKQVTLPRLELCAAALLVRLVTAVRRTLNLTAPTHLWSDSTVALGWIRGHPSRWKTYVANRVSEIQSTLPDALWHHIPGSDNPADCASRGLSPGDLVTHPLWWSGPSWLLTESTPWITSAEPKAVDLPEERTQTHAITATAKSVPATDLLTRFSSLHRLLRVTALCRRWLRKSRPRSKAPTPAAQLEIPPVSVAELNEAQAAWIRAIQSENSTLATDQRKGHSILNKLNPFLDSQGILRVGGRLKHASLPLEEKHPAILPKDSYFTRLVVENAHRRTMHGGMQLTLGTLRQQFWIPQGRALVKTVILRCFTCIRWRAAQTQQRMGDLPRRRVTPERPFLHSGVDYAGPIMLRTTKGRGHRAYKGFIAVFVCLVTKAVHLEVVSDYSAEAFLAALRRFISRRGLCRSLTSDCGTNFVGADAQLRAFFNSTSPSQRRIANELAVDQIQWRFNPPAAPHFGGLWEAAVKSMKHHLRRILGDTKFTYEEMSTLLTQVEACLNSRPIHALSNDPDDLTALTPGHFLVGSALNAVPEPSLEGQTIGPLKRWQLTQQMRDHFWKRWSQEYIQSLLHRPKWLAINNEFQVGRLCLVRGENTPPSRWPLARIIAVHPGEDGLVRVVSVRTSSAELKRPVVKLVLLPMHDIDDPGINNPDPRKDRPAIGGSRS